MDIDAIENTTRQSRDDEQHDKNARRKPYIISKDCSSLFSRTRSWKLNEDNKNK